MGYKVRLTYFSDETTGVEVETAAESQEQEPSSPEVIADDLNEPASPSGDESPVEPSVDPKAFAARLNQERQKWEQEQSEKFGGFDHYKKVTDFVLERGGYESIEALNDAIEQQRLEELAEENNATPEMMRRLEELEAKAQKAEEYEKQQEQVQTYRQFRTALESFSNEKQINPDELESFMVENDVANFNVAYNAFRTEQLEQQLTSAKETAIKEYLESKKAPRVEGTGAPGVIADKPTTDWNEARQNALARMRAANQQI
jgi:hypothetical protein